MFYLEAVTVFLVGEDEKMTINLKHMQNSI
jgi:hypothetical protein